LDRSVEKIFWVRLLYETCDRGARLCGCPGGRPGALGAGGGLTRQLLRGGGLVTDQEALGFESQEEKGRQPAEWCGVSWEPPRGSIDAGRQLEEAGWSQGRPWAPGGGPWPASWGPGELQSPDRLDRRGRRLAPLGRAACAPLVYPAVIHPAALRGATPRRQTSPGSSPLPVQQRRVQGFF